MCTHGMASTENSHSLPRCRLAPQQVLFAMSVGHDHAVVIIFSYNSPPRGHCEMWTGISLPVTLVFLPMSRGNAGLFGSHENSTSFFCTRWHYSSAWSGIAAMVDHLPTELTTEMSGVSEEYVRLAPESEPEDGQRYISVLGAGYPCLPRILN